MNRSKRCANPRCGDLVGINRHEIPARGERFGLCPSCWLMAKTSFAFGAGTVAIGSFVLGLVWSLVR